MTEFKDKVAVVTGAASGIGKGIAKNLAAEGMKLVIADIEAEKLNRTSQEFIDAGAEVLAIQTDVSKYEALENLADKAIKKYGAVHLLCNNAGVGIDEKPIWEIPLEHWNWVLGVNLLSVIYGMKVFIPIMLKQDTDCYIINTSSIAGLSTGALMPMYSSTKHAVVALSESTYNQLKFKNAKIKIAVLCPGFVKTNVVHSLRNKPESIQIDESTYNSPIEQIVKQAFMQAVNNGLDPDEVGKIVIKAMKKNLFYILTHETDKALIQSRFDNILQQKKPEPLIPIQLQEELDKLTSGVITKN